VTDRRQTDDRQTDTQTMLSKNEQKQMKDAHYFQNIQSEFTWHRYTLSQALSSLKYMPFQHKIKEKLISTIFERQNYPCILAHRVNSINNIIQYSFTEALLEHKHIQVGG